MNNKFEPNQDQLDLHLEGCFLNLCVIFLWQAIDRRRLGAEQWQLDVAVSQRILPPVLQSLQPHQLWQAVRQEWGLHQTLCPWAEGMENAREMSCLTQGYGGENFKWCIKAFLCWWVSYLLPGVHSWCVCNGGALFCHWCAEVVIVFQVKVCAVLDVYVAATGVNIVTRLMILLRLYDPTYSFSLHVLHASAFLCMSLLLECTCVKCVFTYSRSEQPVWKRWHLVSNVQDFPAKWIYEPWGAPLSVQREAGCIIGQDYPAPIVDHAVVSKQNMARMKAAYAVGKEAAAGPASDPDEPEGSGTASAVGTARSGKRKARWAPVCCCSKVLTTPVLGFKIAWPCV